MSLHSLTVAATLLLVPHDPAAASASDEVRVEYIAHAAFVIEHGSTRILIDPYNSTRWLGYDFPRGLQADAVLVSHPHYDHNATYQLPAGVPIFTRAGRYKVGGITFEGISNEHAHAEAFRRRGTDPWHTVWVIDAAGLRIAHLGDGARLSEAAVRAIGRADVVFIQVDDNDYFLPRAEIDRTMAALKARITVPMHYALEGLSAPGLPFGALDAWLSTRTAVRRPTSSVLQLNAGTLPAVPEVVVLRPSPAVRPWSDSLAAALKEYAQLTGGTPPDVSRRPAYAVARLQALIQAAPGILRFYTALADALRRLGRAPEAIGVLEQGLSRAADDDGSDVIEARLQLARGFVEEGKTALAALQYRWIERNGRTAYRDDAVREAERYLQAGEQQSGSRERHIVFDGSGGARLHADIHAGPAGPGAPVILLLHQGGGSARGEYGPIIPRLLAGGFNVMAVDLRGGGERFGSRNRTVDEWKGPRISYCDEYSDVEAAVRHLQSSGLRGKRVMWGSSYSASLAIRFAAEHPSAVAGVLAFSPAAAGPMQPCTPHTYIPRLQTPLLVLRPAAEAQSATARRERTLVEEHGDTFHVAEKGEHGSSMLVAERTGSATEREWDVVWAFLARVTGAARR